MESIEHQEWRGRQHLSFSAILKAALIVGAILFVMSGGGPWSSAGAMNKVMGRDFVAPMWVLMIGHFSVALIYATVIGAAVYRFKLLGAVGIGLLVAFGLYGLNYIIYLGMGAKMQSPEFVAFFVHFVFGLFATALYKAFAVPKTTHPIKQ